MDAFNLFDRRPQPHMRNLFYRPPPPIGPSGMGIGHQRPEDDKRSRGNSVRPRTKSNKQGWGGSEIRDLSSLEILPNLGTGTELSSNFSETSLTGTELKELKFQQFHVQQGTEELGSLIFQRNFPDPA